MIVKVSAAQRSRVAAPRARHVRAVGFALREVVAVIDGAAAVAVRAVGKRRRVHRGPAASHGIAVGIVLGEAGRGQQRRRACAQQVRAAARYHRDAVGAPILLAERIQTHAIAEIVIGQA